MKTTGPPTSTVGIRVGCLSTHPSGKDQAAADTSLEQQRAGLLLKAARCGTSHYPFMAQGISWGRDTEPRAAFLFRCSVNLQCSLKQRGKLHSQQAQFWFRWNGFIWGVISRRMTDCELGYSPALIPTPTAPWHSS